MVHIHNLSTWEAGEKGYVFQVSLSYILNPFHANIKIKLKNQSVTKNPWLEWQCSSLQIPYMPVGEDAGLLYASIQFSVFILASMSVNRVV